MVENNKFSPFSYFGCEYMKDYKFYIANPKLDIAFKDNPDLHNPDELKFDNDFSPNKTETYSKSTIDLNSDNGDEILDQISMIYQVF